MTRLLAVTLVAAVPFAAFAAYGLLRLDAVAVFIACSRPNQQADSLEADLVVTLWSIRA